MSRLDHLSTALVVTIGLIVGFGVADVTGVRALGGIVLFVAGVTAGLAWLRRDGGKTTAILSAVYLGGFVLSHVLALAIGAWPSVFVVTAISAGSAYAMSDRKVPE